MLCRRRPVGTKIALIAYAVIETGVVATYLLAPLNGNLRYEAGVKIVSSHSGAATFSHRPVAFRWLMDGIFRAADLGPVGVVGFEITVPALLAALAAGAGALLVLGLRRRAVPDAPWYGVVVAGALILLGPISAGEPDWMAVLLAAAGVGAALLGDRRPWPFALLAGALLVATAGMKIVTLPTAMLAVLAIALIDRRQALRSLVAAAGVGLAYITMTVLAVPWELSWLLDIRSVQNDARTAVAEAPDYFAALVADRPVLALVPAALVLGGRRDRLVAVASLAVCAAPVVAQGQYFDYHAIPLVMVAAIILFRGLVGLITPGVGIRHRCSCNGPASPRDCRRPATARTSPV